MDVATPSASQSVDPPSIVTVTPSSVRIASSAALTSLAEAEDAAIGADVRGERQSPDVRKRSTICLVRRARRCQEIVTKGAEPYGASYPSHPRRRRTLHFVCVPQGIGCGCLASTALPMPRADYASISNGAREPVARGACKAVAALAPAAPPITMAHIAALCHSMRRVHRRRRVKPGCAIGAPAQLAIWRQELLLARAGVVDAADSISRALIGACRQHHPLMRHKSSSQGEHQYAKRHLDFGFVSVLYYHLAYVCMYVFLSFLFSASFSVINVSIFSLKF